jgi:F-type H+-transporting ATPase subunit alpha
VGGAAQKRAMKQVAGRLRLEHAQYRELAAFAQFGSDMDASTRRQLDRGARITEIYKQPQYRPLSLAQQVSIIFAVTNGFLDDVPVDRIQAFEAAWHQFMTSNHPEWLDAVNTAGQLDDALTEKLRAHLTEFKTSVPY